MGPVAGGPGIPGCPLQLVATCNGAAGGVIVPRVAMAPGVAAWQGGGRVAWQHGCNCNGGGRLFHVEHLWHGREGASAR